MPTQSLEQSVLFVSIAFPPKSDAEGLQVAKYAKYLTRECQGHFPIDVVTSQLPTLYMPRDAGLETCAGGTRQTVALRIFENKYTNYLLRLLWPSLVESPDSKFSFHWQSRLVARRLKAAPSLIYSRSFPASSAVMAMKLKKHYNVPWIMHLSDPWADCPNVTYRGRSLLYNQQMERRCFEAADVVCLTSKKTIAYYEKKYASLDKRYEFYPNVYDPDDVPDRSSRPFVSTGKLRLVHTGSVAGFRDPVPFLRAVRDLPREVQDKLDIIFAGPMDRTNSRIFREYRCDCVSDLGPLLFKDALELQRSADVLLLLDFAISRPELRVYFPSKILDYMITGKPILAISDDGSEVQSFIQGELGDCIMSQDSEGIRRQLLWLIDAKSSKSSTFFAPRQLQPEFDASRNAKRLTELFRELMDGQRG